MEKQVANTLLETPKIVQIGGRSYAITPPSIATMVLFSSYISEFKEAPTQEHNPVAWLMSQTDKLENIGWGLSAIVVGAKDFYRPVKPNFWRFWQKKSPKTQGEKLAREINSAPIDEVLKVFFELLNFMRLHDFFQLTTSLTELNITKKTQPTEVEKTTAFGQL